MLGRKSLSVIEKGGRSCRYLRNSSARHIHSSPVSPARFNWGMTVVPEKQAYVIERFGKQVKTLRAGTYFLIPFVDRVAMKLICKEEPEPSARNSTEATNASVETDLEVKIVNPKLRNVALFNEVGKLAQATMGEDCCSVEMINMEEKAVGDRKAVILKFKKVPGSWNGSG